jgi:hypothetical protein
MLCCEKLLYLQQIDQMFLKNEEREIGKNIVGTTALLRI